MLNLLSDQAIQAVDDLFGSSLEQVHVKDFYDYAAARDRAGALRHLQTLSVAQIEREVLLAGFSSVGTRGGKAALIEYSINQIGKRAPFRVNTDY